MRVAFEPLDGTDIRRMVVVEPRETDHIPGETAGYWCPECHQADETLDQIWHEEYCHHAGEHGRAHYDDLEPDVDAGPTPEFDRAHPITVIIAAETEGAGAHNGEVIAFRCECGNADEDVFEIVHDERCDLADCNNPVGGQLSPPN